ncbi:MAG: RrF2 family transcriptional regulator [Candidatus Dormibacteria bacterium]
MLKISSRGHYGLRLMTELARSHGRGPVSLTEVARIEQLPLPYLEQLVVPLRRAGLVEGTRGLHGGYKLAAPPASTTVGAILRVLEGPVAPVECASDDYTSGGCGMEPNCNSRGLWLRVKQSVEEVLDGTSLADLLSDPSFQPRAPRAIGIEQLPVFSVDPVGLVG